MALTTETLSVRGSTIQLLRGGSGAPLLYLHGLLADIHSLPEAAGFTTFHEALAASFAVSAPALPGYADSQGFDELDTIEDAVFFCLDVLDTLGLDTVNLVGASLGGWVATEFASRYSHRLRKLVLINPLGVSTPEARIGNFFYTVHPQGRGRSARGARAAVSGAELRTGPGRHPRRYVSGHQFSVLQGPDGRRPARLEAAPVCTTRVFNSGCSGSPRQPRLSGPSRTNSPRSAWVSCFRARLPGRSWSEFRGRRTAWCWNSRGGWPTSYVNS